MKDNRPWEIQQQDLYDDALAKIVSGIDELEMQPVELELLATQIQAVVKSWRASAASPSVSLFLSPADEGKRLQERLKTIIAKLGNLLSECESLTTDAHLAIAGGVSAVDYASLNTIASSLAQTMKLTSEASNELNYASFRLSEIQRTAAMMPRTYPY